jgi:hypothetical protein
MGSQNTHLQSVPNDAAERRLLHDLARVGLGHQESRSAQERLEQALGATLTRLQISTLTGASALRGDSTANRCASSDAA